MTPAPALAAAPALAPAAAAAPVPRRLRALFVSDLHLGYRGADIGALNALLADCEIEHLYLVGDILDGWKLEKSWYWTQAYCDLVDTLMALRRRRTSITLLTGNHDEKLREIVPRLLRLLIHNRFGIRIEDRCIHRTATGQRLLVLHGDQFDGRLMRRSSKMADRLWNWLTETRPARPPRRWSLDRTITREGGTLAERYAAAALRQAQKENADGIVFGHSHVPLLDRREGRWLANCGGWTQAIDGFHSAVTETPDGRLHLLRWPASPEPAVQAQPAVLHLQDPDSARVIRLIHALWRPQAPMPALGPRRPRPAKPAPEVPPLCGPVT